jgi:SpoVK/Ycf46/Vps4 family AAA+-type ATPase
MADENVEQFIDAEVQRRVGRQTRRFHEEISDLRDINKELTARLIERHEKLKRLLSEPLCFGTLLKVNKNVDPHQFKTGDEVIVVDPDSPYFQQSGKIISGLNNTNVVEEGDIAVKLQGDIVADFPIGIEGKDPAQVRLAEKEDGTYAVVSIDGKAWEVKGLGDLTLEVGEPVKCKPDTKAILSRGYDLHAGPICHVVAVTENGSVEIEHKGEKHLINNPRGFDLEEGDRVACDPTMLCVMEKLKRDNRDRYKLTTELNTTWDDIGGLEVAKQQIQDALELPFLEPDLFNYYNVQPLRGVLLYGPPGCGKTLLARVMAWAVAQAHGKEAIESGYIFVKSPEILSKWVGNTESEIRELFQRARQHYKQHGYKALLAFDEADAIMPQR